MKQESHPQADHSIEKVLLPCQIDDLLRHKIRIYLNHSSLWSLASELEGYVNGLYQDIQGNTKQDKSLERELNRHIKSTTPDRQTLEKFMQGRPIPLRVMNSLANFFHVQYQLKNFRPEEDFAELMSHS